MALSLFQMVGGILLLTIGAELMVRASVSLSRRVGISPLVVGLTVVSVGTSMPELVVSLDAVARGSAALGIGNVVGSNISNIALILGIAALVQPMKVEAQVVRFDGPVLVGVSLLLLVLILDGKLGHLDGGLFAMGVLAYLFYNIWAAKQDSTEEETAVVDMLSEPHSLPKEVGLLVVGIAGLIVGADILVGGALDISHRLQVPEIVIGLTVVAIGTSLPELATSVMAAHRGEGDIAIGNAFGSCILNILGILGITALVQPLSTASLTALELVTMVGLAVLVLLFLRTDFVLGRKEGGVLLFIYAGYLGLLFWG